MLGNRLSLVFVFIFFATVNLASAEFEEDRIGKPEELPVYFNPWSTSYFLTNPFLEMERSRWAMNNIFSQLEQSQVFNPKLSLEETEKNYLVKVDLPGLEKDSINVELENKILTISGERQASKETKNDKGFYHSERSFGAFRRSVKLPDDIKDTSIEADYEQGVLKIKIPRELNEKASSKQKIPIHYN